MVQYKVYTNWEIDLKSVFHGKWLKISNCTQLNSYLPEKLYTDLTPKTSFLYKQGQQLILNPITHGLGIPWLPMENPLIGCFCRCRSHARGDSQKFKIEEIEPS